MNFPLSSERCRRVWITLMCFSVIGGFSLAVDDRLESWSVSVESERWIAQPCGAGTLWSASQTYWSAEGPYIIPVRTWTLAIPVGSKPRLQIVDLDLRPLHGEPARYGDCAESILPRSQTMAGRFAWGLSRPYIRDGLRLVDLTVPLFIKQGGQWMRREKFTVTVDYGAWTRQPGSPGARALARVANPRAARAFGVEKKISLLRRMDAAELRNTQWIASMRIGDRDPATFREDGFYGISFDQIARVLRATRREGALDGVPIRLLTVAAGSADTMPRTPQSSEIIWGNIHEIPVEIRDRNQNGIWDSGDSLIFFATGTSLWKRSFNDSVPYYFSASPYSFERLYYLGIRQSGAGLRLSELPARTGGQVLDVLWRPVRAEKDVILRDNAFGRLSSGWEEDSGMEWFWIWCETMKDSAVLSPVELRMPQTTKLPGLVPGRRAYVGVSFFPHRSLDVSNNSQNASRISFEPDWVRYQKIQSLLRVNGTPAFKTGERMAGGTWIFATEALSAEHNDYEITVLPNGEQPDRFDGYTVLYPWRPQWSDSTSWIFPGSVRGAVRIPVEQAPGNLKALRVVNEIPVGVLSLQNGYLLDSVDEQNDTRWFLYRPEQTPKAPVSVQVYEPVPAGVADLVDLPADVEYLLIAPSLFIPGALELKALRSGNQVRHPLRTEVVRLEDIALYFGGGVVSPVAVRDFLRYAVQRAPDLRYATLIGDGHADYRRLRASSPINWIPPYESEDMGSDEFYAALDSGEVVFYGRYDRDLAIGRIPVNTLDQLRAYVEKAKDYEARERRDWSNWRNSILLAADDASYGGGVDPTRHAEKFEILHRSLDSMVTNRGFQVDVYKLYLHSYLPNGVGEKPEAARDLIDRMTQGMLLTFYSGHGSPIAWADEGLLAPSSLPGIRNRFRTTILGSFACTVGRFDQPSVVSLSESFLLAPHYGAIASIGAMRESYPTPNTNLARRLVENILVHGELRLGDALNKAKWTGIGEMISDFERYNSEKYVLLGEPVLEMPGIWKTIALDQRWDSLQALQKVRLSGTVDGISEGVVFLQVREGAAIRVLKQQVGNSLIQEPVLFQGNVIYAEQIPLRAGKFSAEFITPRKIAFGDTAAEIRLWAWTPSGEIARGLARSIRISGTSAYADSIRDQEPPRVEFRPCGQLDSLARVYPRGQRVRLRIPACVDVVVRDSTGLDLREEADEGLTFEVPGKEDPWHPYPFLEQSGKRVLARMNFGESWSPGTYTLRVRAQDILGNAVVADLDVELTDSYRAAIANVFNAPNPMGHSGTIFYFTNLVPEAKSQVNIQIFDAHGRLVQVLRNVRSGETRWNGRDRFNRVLANGLYYYVLTCTIFSDDAGRSKQVFQKRQKLVISR